MGLTVANYLAQPLFPDCDPPDAALRLIAAVRTIIIFKMVSGNIFWQICITGLTWLNCYSTRITTKLQNLFMVILVHILNSFDSPALA